MLKIWGKIIKDNKIIADDVVTSNIDGDYQANLKSCITELCTIFDISKPYWLPINLEQYNKMNKTIFNQNNFIEEIDFDKFIIAELNVDEK